MLNQQSKINLIQDSFNSIHLDIGCGANPRNPFNCTHVVGLDICDRCSPGNNFLFVQADPCLEPLPFPDSHFDSVSAFDFLEHVPRLVYLERKPFFPFIHLMNEIHRVLKPGGYFLAITPLYPMDSTFSDPTHVNPITIKTLAYFAYPHLFARMYGFTGCFRVIHNMRVNFQYYLDSLIQRPSLKSFMRVAMGYIFPRIKQHITWCLVADK